MKLDTAAFIVRRRLVVCGSNPCKIDYTTCQALFLCTFMSKWQMSTFSVTLSQALTIATRCHEYSRGQSKLLPVQGVLVSFVKLHSGGKWPF